MARRQEWEQATARSRQLAIAADAELRRRYPDRKIEPLRPAEPGPVSDAERQHPDLIPHQRNAQPARAVCDLELRPGPVFCGRSRTAANETRTETGAEMHANAGSAQESDRAMAPIMWALGTGT